MKQLAEDDKDLSPFIPEVKHVLSIETSKNKEIIYIGIGLNPYNRTQKNCPVMIFETATFKFISYDFLLF
jgi:hypothetical protein